MTNTATSEEQLQWSPDGAHLAYKTFEVGLGYRLTTLAMRGPAAVGPTILGPMIDRFAWSPDGAQLLLLQVLVSNPSGRPQTYKSTIATSDASFRQPSVPLVVVDSNITCPPSWQRVGPPTVPAPAVPTATPEVVIPAGVVSTQTAEQVTRKMLDEITANERKLGYALAPARIVRIQLLRSGEMYPLRRFDGVNPGGAAIGPDGGPWLGG